MVKPELKPTSHLRYSTSIRSLLKDFGGKRLDEVRADAINLFKAAILRLGMSPSTVNRDLACLRRMRSVAVKEEIIPGSPFFGRRVEFLEENRRERVVSFAEERGYLTKAN